MDPVIILTLTGPPQIIMNIMILLHKGDLSDVDRLELATLINATLTYAGMNYRPER